MNRRTRKKLAGRLVEAAGAEDRAEARAVLRTGLHPDTPDAVGTTALYAAAVHGDGGMVALLLAAGAAPDRESAGPGAEGTPLCAASCWGHTDAVRALLAHGADPELREDGGTGRTPREWAAAGPHSEATALLTAAARPA
ncbi:serine/threonine protein kinase [Streptomyces solincola]|uniref:Serine/threonine protein kinase n=1 Tax=Streptomyces solincola TaxID=2100817 RepID=A0A2S9PUG7_9ACTN|nr:ankyrin repeat domain-containing protein [Streptomyces solincola]PRH78058.1 serine/threonine protein kinase [Streptomyces solincola]